MCFSNSILQSHKISGSSYISRAVNMFSQTNFMQQVTFNPFQGQMWNYCFGAMTSIITWISSHQVDGQYTHTSTHCCSCTYGPQKKHKPSQSNPSASAPHLCVYSKPRSNKAVRETNAFSLYVPLSQHLIHPQGPLLLVFPNVSKGLWEDQIWRMYLEAPASNQNLRLCQHIPEESPNSRPAPILHPST